MMYQLLPFISACSTVLPTLPIEVWCLILRQLDQKSLLSMVRSSNFFKSIAKDDIVLRQSVRQAIKDEQKEILFGLTRPGMSAAVTREEQAQLFGTNGQKKVSIRKCFHVFQITSKENTMKPIGKVLKAASKTNRFKPYRI